MVVVVIALSLLLAVNGLYTISCIIHIRKIQYELEQRLEVETQLNQAIRGIVNNQQELAMVVGELVRRAEKPKRVSEINIEPVFKSPMGEA